MKSICIAFSILLSSAVYLTATAETAVEEPHVASGQGLMYWANRSNGKIQRANLDGTNVEDLITGLSIPENVLLDLTAGKIYWSSEGGGKIQRANLDGTGIEDLITGLGDPEGIALDVGAGRMYWSDRNFGTIQRGNLDGSNIEVLVTGLSNFVEDMALDLAAGKIYWTNQGSDTIERANLDGTNIEVLVSGLADPSGIALDLVAGKMYWNDEGGGKIKRANIDGTSVENLVTTLSIPEDVELDLTAGKIYWTDRSTNKIQRANLDGTNIEDLVTGLSMPIGIALDVAGVSSNAPPTANAGPDQTLECAAPTGTAVTLDASGSTDLDDDTLAFSWSGPFPEGGGTTSGATPTVTLPSGSHTITLTIDDGHGETDSDDVEITIEDNTNPLITLTPDPITLWPPNHKYRTTALGDFVTGAGDTCDGSLSAADVTITAVASDEPEDATGGGDGNTTDDIVIAGDCQSVNLRSERQGGGNGRVYTISVAATDASGNIGEASFQVHVPHSKKETAIDDGAAYSVDCGASKRATDAVAIQEVPEGVALHGNHPNPFNPTTEIRFDLPEQVHVRLLVYDLTGRLVARLVNASLGAGTHAVTFDASSLPSGVYLYRLTTGSYTLTKTMTLLK